MHLNFIFFGDVTILYIAKMQDLAQKREYILYVGCVSSQLEHGTVLIDKVFLVSEYTFENFVGLADGISSYTMIIQRHLLAV